MIAILFDLDGTLIDSVPDIQAAVNHVFEAEGQAGFDLATVTGFVGNGLPMLVRRAMAARSLDAAAHDRLTQAVLARYTTAGSGLTRVYPGVSAALELLQTAGHPMGICTNKPEAAARQILEELDLAQFFQSIVGGDRLSVLKPDPAPLHLCMAELGVETALFVGDSEIDAAAAQQANLPFLLYTEGYRKSPVAALPHDASFETFSALPWLVAEYG